MAIPAAELPEPSPSPVLRLVPTHVHQWRLVSVEYDDFAQVRMFECTACPEVLYD
ncbi:MAG TPA: hypothetical protein VFK34_08830 [Marmoricola sp.]|jgi:hypothetical protein|nr:hypothetical protein [Marmoricola sp.]